MAQVKSPNGPDTKDTRRSCVVTGAAGFIGYTLSTRLLEGGWRVVGVDAFTDSYGPGEKVARAERLSRLPRFTFIRGDLATMALSSVLQGSEVVFHLAGRAGVRQSFDLKSKYVHDNVIATRAVVVAAQEMGVRRLVYASSSSLYGNTPPPFREDGPLAPISPYGQTKLEAEKICLSGGVTGDLESIALRYFTVYGPEQRPDMGIRLFLEAAIAGRSIKVFGDGSQRRDFTYVDDIVRATIAAADTETFGCAVNIGGGSDVSVSDLLLTIQELVGKPVALDNLPFARGDVNKTEADLTLARKILDFEPKVRLREGVERELAWLRDLSHNEGA